MSRLISDALSMESASKDEPVAVTPEQELRTELALESDVLELQGIEHQMRMEEYQISELDHAVASLESIRDSISASLESNERGLDRVAAEGYQHAVHAVLGDSLPNPIASLESFGGTSQAHRATEVSLEKISDSLKKAWDAFIRAVKKAYETVKEFFKKIFDAAEKMNKKIQDKKSVLDGLKDQSPAKKFEVPKAGMVVYQGSVAPDSIEKGLGEVQNSFIPVINDTVEQSKSYYDELVKFYAGEPENADDLKSASEKHMENLKKVTESVDGKVFPGNKTISYEIESDGDIPHIKPPKVVDAGNGKDPKETEVETPSVKWLQSTLGSIEKTLESLVGNRDARENLNDARKEAANKAEALIKAQSDGKLSEWWDDAKVRMALRGANRDYARSVSQMDSYVFSYLRALMAYIDAATKAYKSSDKDSKDSQESVSTEGDDEATSGDEKEGGESEGDGEEDDD